MAGSGTNLFKEGAEAKRITRSAAEPGLGVQIGEFTHGGDQFGLQSHAHRKFPGRLRIGSRVAALLEEAQKFRVQPRCQLGIATLGYRSVRVPEQSCPAEE